MNCSRFQEVLSEYLDGILPQSEAILFGEHALKCRACRSLLDDVRAAVDQCKAGSEVETPTDLEAVLAMISVTEGPIDCTQFEELITEFLDGFVPALSYHRFEQHSAECDTCSTLLTDVVYAVAACHSVHTYEEFDVSASLVNRLAAIPLSEPLSFKQRLAGRLAAMAGWLTPQRTQAAPWRLATASMLAFGMLAILLFGFSDDRSVTGIYRQAQVRAGELYSRGSDLYSQREELVAGVQQVSSGIDEIWQTLGGEPAGAADSVPNQTQRQSGTATPSPR